MGVILLPAGGIKQCVETFWLSWLGGRCGECYWQQWVEARDAAKHPAAHRTPPHMTEKDVALNVHSAEMEKPWVKECDMGTYFCDPCSLVFQVTSELIISLIVLSAIWFTQRKDFWVIRREWDILDLFWLTGSSQEPKRFTETSTIPIFKSHNPQLLMSLTLVSAHPKAILANKKILSIYLYLQNKFFIFMRNASKSWGQREN